MSQSSQMGRHRQHGPQQQQALEAAAAAVAAAATCSPSAAATAAVTSRLQEVITCTTSSQQLASVLSQPVLNTPPAVSSLDQLEQAPQASPSPAAGRQSDADRFSPSHQKQQLQLQAQKSEQQQQALGSGPPSSINPDTRTHVVAELFDTERSYVESLQILIEKYMRPLKVQALIDSNLVDEIFYTIPELMQHHTIFLNALQERLAHDRDSSQVIGNVFIETFASQQIIDTYTKFINNWKNARHAIKVATQTRPAFKGFLESTSREHKNKLTLDALLIMPVQRVPRYELLIKELIKHTPAEHPDHMPLVRAQQKIHELALKIDRAEREMVHQEQLRELEALIENHSGLIQQPQRDFIRYDLVTIASSTLTVTKKERVLFLFCDLLIITSVKKKVSRRSNLQAAFASSDHDITLLEGNKFKLILRVSLDQVDIRCDNNEQTQLWQQQQQQHELELLNLAKERQALDERRSKLESDLLVLNQMERLADQLSTVERESLAASLAETTSNTLGQLQSLEAQRADCESSFIERQQQLQQQQQQQQLLLLQKPQHLQALGVQDSRQSQVAAVVATGEQGSDGTAMNLASDQDQQQHHNAASASNSTNNKQLDATLEFIINQEVSLRDLLKMSSNASSRDESQLVEAAAMQQAPLPTTGTSNPAATGSAGSLTQNKPESQLAAANQNSNSESLVVSFPSFDRRQAFIEAFLGAKRERFKQQQRRLFLSQHPDQQLLKSRSVASDMRRRAKLQHQDEIGHHYLHQDRSLSNLSSVAGQQQQQRLLADGVLSAPCSSVSQIGRCASCSSHQNLCSRPNAILVGSGSATTATAATNSNHHHHHHHHHQLMHQPASHPALLHTICCHEQHNDISSNNNSNNCDTTTSGRASMRSLERDNSGGSCQQLVTSRLSDAASLGQTVPPCLVHAASEPNEPALARRQILSGLKFVPRFLAAAPTAGFLNSQHPALQLTCSVQPHSPSSASTLPSQSGMRSQTVCDRSGQLWLCMSNGYVSHIALIEFVASDCGGGLAREARDEDELNSAGNSTSGCFSMVPVVKSSGDVCKSRINCAVQVSWPSCGSRRMLSDSADLLRTEAKLEQRTSESDDTRQGSTLPQAPQQQAPPEVSIKSASPPMNIAEPRRSVQVDEDKFQTCRQMSHSAPAVALTEGQTPANRPSSSSWTGPEEANNSGRKQQQALRRASHHKNPSAQHHQHQHHHQHNAHQHHHRCAPSSTLCNQPNAAARYNHRPLTHHPPHHQHGGFGAHSHNPHYSNRHHTVSLAELRRAHERQIRSTRCDNFRDQRHHLAPPANTPSHCNKHSDNNSSNRVQTDRSGSLEQVRSSTPPARHVSAGTRTKQLRHQASLKTSAILAKLVGSAGRGSSYLRRQGAGQSRGKSEETTRNSSDGEDQSSLTQNELSDAGLNPADSVQSIATPQQQPGSMVSPLSSISSLNSSNSSSMTPNWASTPLHSSCTGLIEHAAASHWAGPQSSCCAELLRAEQLQQQRHSSSPSREDLEQVAADEAGCSLRSRSATVPSRAFCEPMRASGPQNPAAIGSPLALGPVGQQTDAYKVNEILEASSVADQGDRLDPGGRDATAAGCSAGHQHTRSSLWLGCDDGSLLVIDCLASGPARAQCGPPRGTDCGGAGGGLAPPCCQQEFCCHNVHSELKLGSPISDIVNFEDRRVFVALSDGRLVVFARQVAAADDRQTDETWQLDRPQIVRVAQAGGEAAPGGGASTASTSKLCLVSEQRSLWFSHGGRVFILDLDGLGLRAIVAPPSGEQLNNSKRNEIEAMESVAQLNSVWVLFNEPQCLIRLHEAGGQHRMLLETSLMQPISKVLSCGNEIIRQHKAACLGTTATLSLFDECEQSNSLLVGTSAGLILILTLSRDQLRELLDSSCSNWSPQVISLRHGHSGHVKFLRLIRPRARQHQAGLVEPEGPQSQPAGAAAAGADELILVSGGAGFDLYGPDVGGRSGPLQHDDSLNHLVFWAI